MPKYTISKFERERGKLIIEIAELNNHRFIFSINEIESKEDLRAKLKYSIECHVKNKKSVEDKYNEIKLDDGEILNA